MVLQLEVTNSGSGDNTTCAFEENNHINPIW